MTVSPLLVVVAAQIIVPGHAIAKVRLGASEAKVFQTLGRPSYGDAATGHFWNTWERNGHVLDIYSQAGEREPTVQMVRVTSPAFRTSSGIGPGSLRRTTLARFPSARRTASFKVPGERVLTELWDDVRHGIAFEFQRNRCRAVTVHRPGEVINERSSSLIQYLRDRSSAEKNRGG